MKNFFYITLIFSITTIFSCSSEITIEQEVNEKATEKTNSDAPANMNCKNDSYPEEAPKFGNNSEIPYSSLNENLKVIDLKKGTGDEVITDDKVIVHYTGWLEDGCIFDSSYIKGKTASFRIGRQRVIKGWDEGIPGMKIGGIRRLEIGSKFAYGEEGFSGTVPENATLIFIVELVDIKRLVQK